MKQEGKPICQHLLCHRLRSARKQKNPQLLWRDVPQRAQQVLWLFLLILDRKSLTVLQPEDRTWRVDKMLRSSPAFSSLRTKTSVRCKAQWCWCEIYLDCGIILKTKHICFKRLWLGFILAVSLPSCFHMRLEGFWKVHYLKVQH